MTSSTAYYLSRAGVGLTTIVHVGGDAVVGLPHPTSSGSSRTTPRPGRS